MKKIFLAGHKGMVGGAICRKLKRQKDVTVITRSRKDLDLMEPQALINFFKSEKPDEVILAAAKLVGFMQTIPTEIYLPKLADTK